MDTLKYGFIGSTKDAKQILVESALEPEIVISFTDDKADSISGFTRYPEYDRCWTQVNSINSEHAIETLENADIDIGFVISWQELLDPAVLAIPTEGFIGRHLSLLPKRRGRAPVAWTLIHGLDTTGQTFFWLDDGVDSGNILLQEELPVSRDDEASDLFDKHANLSISLLNRSIDIFNRGDIPRTPQDDSKATYTHPRRPDMGLIDWTQTANRIYDFIRGQSHPYPGAFTYNAMDRIRVWHARVRHPTRIVAQPGEVIEKQDDQTLSVQTSEGILAVEIEPEANNHALKEGNILGNNLGCGD